MAKKASHVHTSASGWSRDLAVLLQPPLSEGVLHPVSTLHIVSECTSTQDVAKELASTGLRCAAVLAERQLSGRGRLGRSWDDTRAMGVPLTIILPSDSHSPEQVALRAGLAACIACERMLIRLGCRKRLGLRWPNDVVVDTGKAGQRIGRKLSGILIETAALATAERVLLVGIGINVLQKSADWPTALQKKATSLADVAGCHAADEALSQTVQQLLRAMTQVWTLTDSEIVAMWQPRSLLQGSWAIFDCATPTGLERVEGIVDAIDPLLRVTVKTTTGSRQLIASRTTLRHDLM